MSTAVYVPVNGPIKHCYCQQDEEEDEKGEEDVGLGVQREESGASIQAADAVPTQQRQETDHQRQNPTESRQAIDPIVGRHRRFLLQRRHHNGASLHCNQQQAEYGGCQRHKQHALSEEPEGRREVKCPAARHADVDHVGDTGEEIAHCDVGNADIKPAATAADAGEDGHQHQQILQDDENTKEEANDHGNAYVGLGVVDGPVLQAASVVIMSENHLADPIQCITVAGETGCVIQMGAR